jgi:deaminated glutathione amidase
LGLFIIIALQNGHDLMKINKYNIAAIQMNSCLDVESNIRQAEKLIMQASDSGAQIAVLPEMFATFNQGYNLIHYQEKLGNGLIQDFLANIAQKYKLWIVSGTIPLTSDIDKNKIKAACLVYDDGGKIVGRYDKMHLFDAKIAADRDYRESATTIAGDHYEIIKTPFGNIGIVICYDIRFPELARSLFEQGMEVLIVPAAFAQITGQAHWEILLRCRAIENFSYVIGAAQAGKSGRRATFGNSMIINPWGDIMQKASEPSPDVIIAEIDLEEIYRIRKQIPVDLHQKIKIYNK